MRLWTPHQLPKTLWLVHPRGLGWCAVMILRLSLSGAFIRFGSSYVERFDAQDLASLYYRFTVYEHQTTVWCARELSFPMLFVKRLAHFASKIAITAESFSQQYPQFPVKFCLFAKGEC